MKNKIAFGLSLVAAVGLLVGIGNFKSLGVAHAQNAQSTVKTNHDLKHLSAIGFMLEDDSSISAKSSPANIDANVAIENAKKAFPGWGKDSSDVKVEYHLVTNTSYHGFSANALSKNPKLNADKHMEKLPSYIVSFTGMSYGGHLPMGYTGQEPIHHEYNVIVDAVSGEPLMGFSYR